MSRIEWTDRTWNPVRGCSRVSEGCRNCYAEKIAGRFGGEGRPFSGFVKSIGRNHRAGWRWTGKVSLIPSKLTEPLRWRKPSRVFVNSMSDLFHEGLSDADTGRVFNVMERADRHTFQVLTKRATRMRDLVSEWDSWAIEPPPNIWLGVSVEDQATADERIPLLLQTPAAKRFVSYEPALGPLHIDVSAWGRCYHAGADGHDDEMDHRKCACHLDWMIVGGESGPGARPCDMAWIRSAVRQCGEAGVPCFVKQLGAAPFEMVEWEQSPPGGLAPLVARREVCVRHPKGGDPSEWPEDLWVREFPA